MLSDRSTYIHEKAVKELSGKISGVYSDVAPRFMSNPSCRTLARSLFEIDRQMVVMVFTTTSGERVQFNVFHIKSNLSMPYLNLPTTEKSR